MISVLPILVAWILMSRPFFRVRIGPGTRQGANCSRAASKMHSGLHKILILMLRRIAPCGNSVKDQGSVEFGNPMRKRGQGPMWKAFLAYASGYDHRLTPLNVAVTKD